MNFAANLKKYRYRSGYKTAKDMAAKLGIPYNTYAAYESGAREPKYQMLCNIASVLHVTLGQLIGFTLEETNLEIAFRFARKAGIEVKSFNNDEVTFENPYYDETKQSPQAGSGNPMDDLYRHKEVTLPSNVFTFFMIRVSINFRDEKAKMMEGVITKSYAETLLVQSNYRKLQDLANHPDAKITLPTDVIQNLDL